MKRLLWAAMIFFLVGTTRADDGLVGRVEDLEQRVGLLEAERMFEPKPSEASILPTMPARPGRWVSVYGPWYRVAVSGHWMDGRWIPPQWAWQRGTYWVWRSQ